MLSTILKTKNQEFAAHFKPGFIQREETVFQFLFSQGEAFYLKITPGTFEFLPGIDKSPTITLNISDHATCWSLLDGSLDGMRAFMEGSYRADGNIVLSQLLLYTFKSNDPTLVYEVKY